MYPSDWLLDDGSSRFDSADPAVYDDWTESWDRIVGKDKEGTPEQVFMVAKTILDYYAKEAEYELGDAESYLKEQLGA
jgi:hypothetical protein